MEARELVRQLFEACLHGRLQEIQSIAPRVSTAGLNNVKDGNGRNALHFAAQGGQTEIVQYLLQNEGVSIDSQDDTGTCLTARLLSRVLLSTFYVRGEPALQAGQANLSCYRKFGLQILAEININVQGILLCPPRAYKTSEDQ